MRSVTILSLFWLLACQKIDPVIKNEYYNVDSLISAQYDILAKSGLSITKTAMLEGDSTSAAMTPDTAEWATELSIFRRIDLSKPKWQGLYQVTDSADPLSNLTVRTFSIDDPEAEVRYLKLYFLNDLGHLRKLEARWVEKNPIYKSQRDMTLHFDDIKNQMILSRYAIKGYQKMILQNEVTFNIEATVNHH